MSSMFCKMLKGLVALSFFTVAYAAEPAPGSLNGFATVYRLRGEVLAGPLTGPERALHEGDRVQVGEKIRASAQAEAVLRTDDFGLLAIRPGAELVAERFSARGNGSDAMVVRLLTGSLRVITGWIGRTHRQGHQIITPTATIGIRGTDHEPYVLTADQPTADEATTYRAGTYDKVNRGGTSLAANGRGLDIDPGRVGFARDASKAPRGKALMTLLLPVLLDKVPGFYVPGAFDAELDLYAPQADALAQRALAQQTPPAPAPQCEPLKLAKTWLAQLDGAITRGDGPGILNMFAPEVTIKAVVRKPDGRFTELDVGRDELVQSTLTTVAQLKAYQHRRLSVQARQPAGAQGCERLDVSSGVIERGVLAGKPYRFESQEHFVLERRDDQWLAVTAETRQR